MTIEKLFEKLSDPSQKRVLYGIYWAINRMKFSGTKSVNVDNCYTFCQWISYKSSLFIIPKLDGFKRNSAGYDAVCWIGGDSVRVQYQMGMVNGNVKIVIELDDTEKIKEQKKEEEQNKKENEEILKKMSLHMRNYFRGNRNCTDEEYDNELLKFGEKNFKLYNAQFK